MERDLKWSIGGYALRFELCPDYYDWVGTLNVAVEGKRYAGFHVGWFGANLEWPTTVADFG